MLATAGWLGPLIGALATSLLGLIGLIVKRTLFGKAENEERATKAAHQAVEAVEDALTQLRVERQEDKDTIRKLRVEVAELRARITELEKL